MSVPQTAYLSGRVTLASGDCLEALRALPDCYFDSCVTDPPYALVSIVKRFGSATAAPGKYRGDEGPYRRASAGFMGKTWDTGERAFAVEFWAEVYRVLKPGAFVVAASGTRTYHRLAVAIEDSGFEVRDMLSWHYGSGFPKSHNLYKAWGRTDAVCTCHDSMCGLREGTDDAFRVVQESQDSDVLPPMQRRPARKGMGGSRVQGCRGEGGGELCESGAARRGKPGMEGRGDISEAPRKLRLGEVCEVPGIAPSDGAGGWVCDGASPSNGAARGASSYPDGVRASLGPQPVKQPEKQFGALAGQSKSQDGGAWPYCDRCGKPLVSKGIGTALKPATEPWCLARKPVQGTVAENVLRYGTGALQIDGTRIGDRWPANVIHDGSPEAVEAFPADEFGVSASRFFYSAKADANDRIGSKHPTVKPVDLMQWLVRLVTPKGGLILDPFAGTGTTGEAAFREGMRAYLVEREPEYQADISRRMGLVLSGQDERRRALTTPEPAESLPLFGGVA